MSRISQVLNYTLVNMILMGVHLSDPSFTFQYWSSASSEPGLLCMMGPCAEGRRASVGRSVRGVSAGGWPGGSSLACVVGSRCGNDPDTHLCLLVCVPSGLDCVWDWSVCCKASGSHSVSGGASCCPCFSTGGQVGWGWLFILVSAHCVLCSRGPRPGDELFPARWGMVFRGKWLWKSQGLDLVSEGRGSSQCF